MKESKYEKEYSIFKKILSFIIPTLVVLSSIAGVGVIITTLVLNQVYYKTSSQGVNGVVSTDSTTCSQIGVNILSAGGNAFDAGKDLI
jgi:gamma-glutamyltranspeptidase